MRMIGYIACLIVLANSAPPDEAVKAHTLALCLVIMMVAELAAFLSDFYKRVIEGKP